MSWNCVHFIYLYYSFIQVIHNQYDRAIIKLVCRFKKLNFKHQKTVLDLQFLKTCQDFKVTLKFLQFCVAWWLRRLRQSQTYQTCKHRLLLEEIRIKKNNLKTVVRELATIKEELLHALSFSYFNHVFNLIISFNEFWNVDTPNKKSWETLFRVIS